nr:EOG090X051L [Eulimnadia texana]
MSVPKVKEMEEFSDEEEHETSSDVRLRFKGEVDSKEVIDRLIRGDDVGNVADLFESVCLADNVINPEEADLAEDMPPWFDLHNREITSMDELEMIMDPLMEDRGVMKKIIKAGEGAVVSPKAFVTVHYKLFLDYGDAPFDSTYSRLKPLTFRLHTESYCSSFLGMDIGVSTMKKNEQAYFIVHPRYAYGELGCPPRIPAQAKILCDITLLNWIDADDDEVLRCITSEERNAKPFDQVLKAAIDEKEQGNALVASEQYRPALRKFNSTFKWFEDYVVKNEEEDQKKVKVLVDLKLNMALCYLRLNSPKKACSSCNDGYFLDPRGDKVYKLLFRKGQALQMMGELEKALKLYERALQLKRSSPDIVNAITDVNEVVGAVNKNLAVVTGSIDRFLGDVAPWKIVMGTAGTTLALVWIDSVLHDGEFGYKQTLKKKLFRVIRAIPAVRNKVEAEKQKIYVSLEDDMNKCTAELPVKRKLPEAGSSAEEILKEAKLYLSLGECDWSNGGLSGCVYNADKSVTELTTQVFALSAWSNPLHPDVFPGIRKMEAEIVQMTLNMFHAGADACGAMTSGGTESLLMACKAYRDYAREVRGIKHPEILMPVTAHAAFNKAAQLYRMKLVTVPVDPVTFKVDVRAMRKAITRNTCMLVASAPGFPHGVIDPVKEIAALGLKYNIPVHVDACLGGFVVAFMDEAGFPLEPFDFRVEGVTSLSADTHKYGYAPKGSSVILYSHPKYRQHQFSVATDWPGGVYASPTLAGSRPGSLIAICWASLMYYGRQGYVEATRKIVRAQRYIENEVRKIKELNVMGKPDACVVAFSSENFNIYRLSDAMAKKGWSLSPLQFPAGVHLCVTYLHTLDGVKEKFVQDIKEVVAEIIKNPQADVGGSAAIYGMAQSVPDRSIVSDIACCFLEAMYSLKSKVSDEISK